jgi:hypothetical protein
MKIHAISWIAINEIFFLQENSAVYLTTFKSNPSRKRSPTSFEHFDDNSVLYLNDSITLRAEDY